MVKNKNSIIRMMSVGLAGALVLAATAFGVSQKSFAEQTGTGSIDVTVKMKEGEIPTPPPDVIKYKVTVPQSILSDGTVIPGVEIEVNEGDILNNDQVNTVMDRDGKTPDKWDVSYTDPATGQPETQEGLTTEELRDLLASLEIEGDVTVSPAEDAKMDSGSGGDSGDDNKDKDKDKDKDSGKADSGDQGTGDDSGSGAASGSGNDNNGGKGDSGSNDNKSGKSTAGNILGTGDILGVTVAALASAAIAALVTGLILAWRRKKEQ